METRASGAVEGLFVVYKSMTLTPGSSRCDPIRRRALMALNPPSPRLPIRGARLVCVALGVLLAVGGAALVSSSTASAAEEEARIVARRLDDGRFEFALQQRLEDGSWSDRQLPDRRFLPTTATAGSWLRSSSLTIRVSGTEVVVRIVARRLDGGSVEFALQQRSGDGSWSDRQLPDRRFLPTTATAGRWLHSTAVTLDTPQNPDGDPPDDGASDNPGPRPQDPQGASPQDAEPDAGSPKSNPQPPPPAPANPQPPAPDDTPPDNENPPDRDPNAGNPEPDPPPPTTATTQPPQEPEDTPPEDTPPDNENPPDDDGEDCDPDDLCFIPLTEEEWRKAREEIFGE